MFVLAVIVATVVWFVVAAILFFNPVVDKIYRTEERHAAVRALPQSIKTIGMRMMPGDCGLLYFKAVEKILKP